MMLLFLISAITLWKRWKNSLHEEQTYSQCSYRVNYTVLECICYVMKGREDQLTPEKQELMKNLGTRSSISMKLARSTGRLFLFGSFTKSLPNERCCWLRRLYWNSFYNTDFKRMWTPFFTARLGIGKRRYRILQNVLRPMYSFSWLIWMRWMWT